MDEVNFYKEADDFKILFNEIEDLLRKRCEQRSVRGYYQYMPYSECINKLLISKDMLIKHYKNELEDKVSEFCKKYENDEVVKRIMCYSNTIGEPEKYDEIVAKANELSSIKIAGQATKDREKFEADDYLVKVIYYYYYKGDKNTVSLPDFVKFVQDEVMTSGYFDDEIDDGMRADINRLAKLVIPEEAAKKRSKYEISEILEVSAKEMDDLYTLYLAKHQTGVKLTLNQFAKFVKMIQIFILRKY